MRERFEEQLSQLNYALVEMGALVETAIAQAIEALKTGDEALARRVIEFDEEIDHKEKEIESLCLKILLQQQPVARDLRLVSSALKMITDMERIGDHAEDISEIAIHLMHTPQIKPLEHIPLMAVVAIGMVRESIDAFVGRDAAKAAQVIRRDDLVDDYFEQIRAELIALIHQNSEHGEQAIDYLMITKYLERIGDHAVNIAEWVLFAITGTHVKDADAPS